MFLKKETKKMKHLNVMKKIKFKVLIAMTKVAQDPGIENKCGRSVWVNDWERLL